MLAVGIELLVKAEPAIKGITLFPLLLEISIAPYVAPLEPRISNKRELLGSVQTAMSLLMIFRLIILLLPVVTSK